MCFFVFVAGEPKRRAQISVGSSSEVSLKVTESDIASLTASIRSPSGREEPCILKRLANGHLGEDMMNVSSLRQHLLHGNIPECCRNVLC